MGLEQKVHKGAGDTRTGLFALAGAGFGYLLSAGNPLGVIAGAVGGYAVDRLAAKNYHQ